MDDQYVKRVECVYIVFDEWAIIKQQNNIYCTKNALVYLETLTKTTFIFKWYFSSI